MKDTMNLIKNLNINNKDYVILACSYGPDSMVLLDLLIKNNLNIIVAHVNHKLRKESDQEEKLLKKYCKINNIIFESKKINKYPKGNLEMQSRTSRYAFFETLIKKYQAKYIFTAHHGDDLIETVLMRIIRGSTLKGYGGFNIISEKANYILVRPLIYYTKEDIINYAKNNQVPYALDYTNDEDNYLRNRLRHNVLPELKKENPQIHLKFLEFNQEINCYEDYFNQKTINLYNKLYIKQTLNLSLFKELDYLFKKRLLQKILIELYQEDIVNINNNHLKLILDLISSNKKNAYINLPNNLKVQKNYTKLSFDINELENQPYNYLITDNLELPNSNIIYENENIEEKSNFVIRLNSKEIKLPLYIRTRKIGDKIKVKNLNGTKKISSILGENKLSTFEREIQPILEDSNGEILWLPGIKKSIFDKQKNETYDIILKYVKKERTK